MLDFVVPCAGAFHVGQDDPAFGRGQSPRNSRRQPGGYLCLETCPIMPSGCASLKAPRSPQFSSKIGSPAAPLRGACAALTLAKPDAPEDPFSREERFKLREITHDHRVSHSSNSADNRIEFAGQIYAEDELHEAIWLVNMELRNGLPTRERIKAQHQITQYQAMLDALQRAGA